MPSTNTYIIDNARIKPGGNDIKGLWVGNSESRYAMLGNTVIYDKVNYILSVNDIANIEPDVTAYTFTTSDYDSKRVHGNGDVDILSITPATHSFTTNTSTASTQVTTVTVSQYDGTNETGCTLNNVTITQKKDYPVSITLAISPKEDIPASGGTRTTGLTEYNYSVKCNYKSGNNDVDITSLATITSNSSSVVGNDLGTTSKDRTKVGTISFTATYTCNEVTKTSEVNVDIYQEKNEVIATEWNNPTVTINPTSSTVASTATSQVFTASATQTGTNTYTSTDTAETTNTSFTWSWASDNAAFTVTSTTTSATVTFDVNTGETSRSASITVSAVGESKTGNTSASLTQKGEEAPSGPYYGSLELSSVTLSCSDVPASGGTVHPSWVGTVYQYEYYLTPGGEETNTGWTDINSIVQVSWSPTGKTGNSLGKTITERTSLGDCVATFTGNSSKTDTKSITVYQEANVIESTEWENPVVELDANQYQFVSNGESKQATASATQSGTKTYTSKETEPTENTTFNWVWSVTGNGFSVTYTSNTATVSATQNTGGARNGGVFAEAVGKNKTGQTSANLYQDGVSPKPSPSIISSGVSYESYVPPTPTTPTWYMKNNSNTRGLYGMWTSNKPSETVSGDLGIGVTRNQYTTTPIILQSFDGAVTGGQASSVSFRNIDTGAHETMAVDSSGVNVAWGGSMTINEGDTVEVTII